MKTSICDVAADGSCFFRSLYHSAKASGALNHILKRLKGTKTKDPGENGFVKLTREALSECIQKKEDRGVIKKVYQTLRVLNKEDYNIIVASSFPSWFASTFRSLPPSEETFRDKFAKKILKKTSWVSEIEVTLIRKMIHVRSNWRLVILNSKPTEKWTPKPNEIYVLNLNETHYNAILVIKEKQCASDKIFNKDTNRCVSKTSCKGYELQLAEILKHKSSLH